MKMKKKLFLIVALVMCALGSAFAQTKVDAKKLGKTLEKNKDSSAVFVSEIDLSEMTVSDSGAVTIPIFAKSKISVVSGMDMTNIKERIAYTKKSQFSVTFETKNLKPKTYAITKIDGIETVEEYNARLVAEKKRERLSNLTKMPVQVVNQEVINVEGTEASWLPGQVQDKLKSNLQDYLGMKTVVDSKSESALKKLQAESESSARDEKSAIEFGKITTAKFAFFVKVRKTGSGYTLSADFTDLTTGEQLASVTSKEYTKAEYLYGSTGAADEITLSLANKLGIKISDLNKNLLTSGSSGFTTDELLALAKQNEEQYKKMMSQYDEELAKLNVSNDLSAIENRRKIEAEKALLVEKQNAEQKRQQELKAQKEREQADAKLEAERSIALKTQRDQMAKDAAAKAAEVRKLKMEKQGVLGQISVIESKKKALVEIRQVVEKRHQELYDTLKKECDEEEKIIRAKAFSTVELEGGKPTQAANRRRENLVWANYENFYNKFLTDCEMVKKATSAQDAALLQEIRDDQKALTMSRTVSSMGDELKISYGTYSGQNNGWNAYISLYSDGVLLYQDTFIVKYEAVTGKKSVNLETETNEDLVEEYITNVDMYNSLLSRGDPIIYFEIDYSVQAQADDKPSAYTFSFDKIRVINTVSGKTVQTSALSKKLARTMKPEYDIREIYGAVAKAKEEYPENLILHNRRKELKDIGLSDERIAEIYEELTKKWLCTMPDDVFTDLKEAALKNREKTEFVIGIPSKNDREHFLLPNSVTKIEDAAFKNYSMKSLTIPNSVTVIGKSAFESSEIRSVTIPNSVTKIGDKTFSFCRSLRSVTIPNSVTEIGDEAFYSTSLRSVTIPNSVTIIGSNAFSDCALTSVTIPNSVTKIGVSAFSRCALTSVTIPNSVTGIWYDTFSYCERLTSVTIPNSVTIIGSNAFYNCRSLRSVTIPNSVTIIGSSAFYNCTSLTSVTIPNSVTKIDDGAFCGCSSLTSVTIPNSVTEIGRRTFCGCQSLTSVTIPNSVTEIGEDAFKYCPSLRTVNYTGTKEEFEKIKGVRNLVNYAKNINFNYREK